jgi:hypothetical protein
MATHLQLWKVCREQEAYRAGTDTDHHDKPDCSSGCCHFHVLEGDVGMDWGVCTEPRSPRAGLLTFEHMGCEFFTVKHWGVWVTPPEGLPARAAWAESTENDGVTWERAEFETGEEAESFAAAGRTYGRHRWTYEPRELPLDDDEVLVRLDLSDPILFDAVEKHQDRIARCSKMILPGIRCNGTDTLWNGHCAGCRSMDPIETQRYRQWLDDRARVRKQRKA